MRKLRYYLLIIVTLILSLCFGGESVSKNVVDTRKSKEITLIDPEMYGKSVKEIPGVFVIVTSKERDSKTTYQGTAFLAEHNQKKYLISVDHNIDWSKYIQIYRHKELIDIRIKNHIRDSNVDIFIAEVETKELAFKLHSRFDLNKLPEMNIVIFGYPVSCGLRKVETSFKEVIYFELEDIYCLWANKPIISGMSGGPWLEKETNLVIGLSKCSLTRADKRRGAGAVIINDILNMIDKLGEKSERGT